MNKDKLSIILLIIILIWSLCGVINTIRNPVTIEDLTVEERIRYEQAIFP